MRIILILPGQKNAYSNLFEVYADLNNALQSLGIESRIVEIRFKESAGFPFGDVDSVDEEKLSDFLYSAAGRNTVFVTVDDHSIVRWLHKNRKIENLVIWAHYFYGARYIFRLYRDSSAEFTTTFRTRLLNLFAASIPNSATIRLSGFYWKTLIRYPIFSQSIWTGLLLERVYSIPVTGMVLIPVDQGLYNFPEEEKREGTLIFLGERRETDLRSLQSVLKTVDAQVLSRLDYFGNEETGKIFEEAYGIKINFIGKIGRRDLLRNYSEHFMTIAPIFDGNFEMVPIQSLMCGTPVISFAQPFLEVTGENDMTANIRNLGEVRRKVQQWKGLSAEARKSMKASILEKMDSKKVAKDLLSYLETLGFH